MRRKRAKENKHQEEWDKQATAHKGDLDQLIQKKKGDSGRNDIGNHEDPNHGKCNI